MYKVEILDQSGNVQSVVKNLVSFTKDKQALKFNDYLSSYGTCNFRVKTLDPGFSTDYLEPYKYFIRIKRFKKTVWYGVITDAPSRTHEFVDIQARTLAFLFTKCEISPSDFTVLTRVFKTGTMGAAITTIFNEAKNRSSSPVASFTIGTIENPYKLNTTTTYTFNDTDYLEMPYMSTMDFLSIVSDITNTDWEVTSGGVFNYRRKMGRFRDISFKWGKYGNMRDYNIPISGSNKTNLLIGLAVNTAGKLIRHEATNAASIDTYKRLWGFKVFENANTQSILNALTKEELRVRGTGVELKRYSVNEEALSLELGDEFVVDIQDNIISERETRRLVGLEVSVSDTGFEKFELITNRRK